MPYLTDMYSTSFLFFSDYTVFSNVFYFYYHVYSFVDFNKSLKNTSEIDKGVPVDTLYLDFAKAFDKVPHLRLIEKIAANGIGGKISKWIKSWLTDRKQRVIVNNATSDWLPVLSGVPQGYVMGPCLYVIHK